ncbi:MAG: mechanosensitive ion channel domain-containing protein [Bacteroidaceae bacterium]
MTEFNQFIHHLLNLEKLAAGEFWSLVISTVILVLAAFLLNHIVRYVLLNGIHRFIKMSKNTWDDTLLNDQVLVRISKLTAPILIYYTIPMMLPPDNIGYEILVKFSLVYITSSSLLLVNGWLIATYNIFQLKDKYKNRPLKGMLQTTQVFLFLIGSIIVISIIISKSPTYLLTTLGASAAIIILIFKDSIMGFVAGIQLSANDMIKVGDWITVPNYDADGTVLEVSLNTVKVQNFDNTIITLPPYALTSGSFRNWKGMLKSGNRRIKRAIYMDMTSIRFCTTNDLEEFKKIDLIRDYIEQTEKEIGNHNKQNNIDASVWANGRRQTNVGVFRAYLKNYLLHQPTINATNLCMVRQLQPTEKGLPVEVYAFANTTNWEEYEQIQSDLFDHILATIPQFGLRLFQTPTGYDLSTLTTTRINTTVSATEEKQQN